MFIDCRVRNINGRERHTSMSCLSYVPQVETEPTAQAWALTGNPACDLSACGMTPQPTEPNWPGPYLLHILWPKQRITADWVQKQVITVQLSSLKLDIREICNDGRQKSLWILTLCVFWKIVIFLKILIHNGFIILNWFN